MMTTRMILQAFLVVAPFLFGMCAAKSLRRSRDLQQASVCERSLKKGRCRSRYEGVVCDNCQCTQKQWVCTEPPTTTTPATTTSDGGVVLPTTTTTTAPPPTTCQSLGDAFQPAGSCSSQGETCLLDSGSCHYWDSGSLTCVPSPWESFCSCDSGTWNCGPIPGCAPCECEHQDVVDGGFCFNHDQQCRDSADASDCTCGTDGVWSCSITTGGGGGGVVLATEPATTTTTAPEPFTCSSLNEAFTPFGSCTNAGQTCQLDSGSCEFWDAASLSCVQGTRWTADCFCDATSLYWSCDPIPGCAPCSCEHQNVVDGGWCFNDNQQCRDQADAMDCTCGGDDHTWSCSA